IRAFPGVMRIGSGKSCRVNALLWFHPFSAFAQSLGTVACGRWHCTQVATAWWGECCQDAYWSRMMWQFAQARGSLEKYESPSAYRNVKAPRPATSPTATAATTAI